ncbi:cation:proton antiporter [Schlegelella sp. S2-27]|uniref:Cation:proton antiporter n=1 Tax=Caldimonas mangrovi TaxID=2944811 RepID=A0ABT0YUM1_9BURK|nr:cation:proton antiporter [Caldimonas mangrovi]MCM5682109.1 cation:proton antiporter [Caldimonas mangrovi]
MVDELMQAQSFLGVAVNWSAASTLLGMSLVVIAGALIGEAVFRFLGLPRIVGYSLVGMGVAAAGYGVASGEIPPAVRLILDLALALLLFELGARIHLRWLRTNPFLLLTSLAESLLTFIVVYLVMRYVGLDVASSAAVGVLAVPASPAVIARVASEFGAEGQVTERVSMMAALNTLYGVFASKLLLAWLDLDQGQNPVQAIVQPLYVFIGSFVVAGLLGYAVARVARGLDLRNENSTLLLLGLITFALALTKTFGLSTLLVPLMAGLWLRNSTQRPWVWPRHFGTAGGVLVLMLFVIVGSSWSVEGLATGGLIALAAMAARGAAKAAAVFTLGWFSGQSLRQGVGLSLALTPLSATALVMYADLQGSHAGFAAQLAPIALSSIAIMELLGALAVLAALRGAHEIAARRT